MPKIYKETSMKTYTKLEVPKQSAWNKRTWRYHAPIWFKEFIDGCKNIIDWLPVIWKDRQWDDYYITKVIQHKIELQREHLVNANRHTEIDRDNKWMTIALNLIEREHNTFYEDEINNYRELDLRINEKYAGSYYTVVTVWEKYDDYLAKYPNMVRKMIKKYPDRKEDKSFISLAVAMEKQKQCRNLLFEVLKQKSHYWWD